MLSPFPTLFRQPQSMNIGRVALCSTIASFSLFLLPSPHSLSSPPSFLLLYLSSSLSFPLISFQPLFCSLWSVVVHVIRECAANFVICYLFCCYFFILKLKFNLVAGRTMPVELKRKYAGEKKYIFSFWFIKMWRAHLHDCRVCGGGGVST